MNKQNKNMYNMDINATRNNENALVGQGFNQNPYINQPTNINNNAVDAQQTNSVISNGDFIKGALIGATLTFLLTNKGAQESIFKAVSKGNELFQAGMEELKERYEDVKAQADSQ